MRTIFTLFLVLLVAGCANRQPTVSEFKVQSRRLGDVPTSPSATAPAPSAQFCLHIRSSNMFDYVLTENNAQAWVTDGLCEADGPRRPVAELVLRWRYRHDNPGSKSCAGADTCSLSEKNYGQGKVFACVSGFARDAGAEAVMSTDWYACPR